MLRTIAVGQRYQALLLGIERRITTTATARSGRQRWLGASIEEYQDRGRNDKQRE